MPPLKKNLAGRLLPPKSGVRVRMYNTGFGDCFLLAFPVEPSNPGKRDVFTMLIDCGVHQRFEGGAGQIRKVAGDIASATGGRLDLVVITHEHTDHTWGFRLAQDIFDQMEIDNLWLAWTEDPDDKLAQLLKQLNGQEVAGLKAAIQKLSQADEAFALKLQSVSEFEPMAEPVEAGKLDELEFLRKKSLKKLVRSEDYRQPGEPPIHLPGVKGVRIFVFGPPRDTDLINILDRPGELYPEAQAFGEASAFAAAAQAGSGVSLDDEQSWVQRNRPFDASFGIPAAEAAEQADFKDFYNHFYGFSSESGQGPAWRRIDTDWLYSAERLALAINAKSNNTSLVLAIEINAGEVLLFAADTQAGSWLAWQNLRWPGQAAGGQTITGADLLKRTVFYKVSQHGSRNASPSSLDQLTHPDLVAMLPVNAGWARDVMNWEYPAPGLLKQLLEKTRGRVIRTDEIPSGEIPPARPENVSPEEWQDFTKRLAWDHGPDHLWVEYTLGNGQD